MINSIYKIIKKIFVKYKEYVLYIFFGATTTFINLAIYLLLTRGFQWKAVKATLIAWLIAVLYAYISNKILVFENYNYNLEYLVKEFFKFLSARIFTGFIEIAGAWLFIDLMNFYDIFVKILIAILVIILNYIFSKHVIFKNE